MQTAKFDQDAAAYIPGPKVRARYGVTDMTIHRWLHDDDMGFPRPYYFGRFRYWLLAELETWERAQPRRRTCTTDAPEAA
jgi:predicted DNA-binding transcriptional regulator AlpA